MTMPDLPAEGFDKIKSDVLRVAKVEFDRHPSSYHSARYLAGKTRDAHGHDVKQAEGAVVYLSGTNHLKKKQVSGVTKYVIGPKGIDLFESSSFSPKPFSAMSITANNVVMVQGHNYGNITQTHTEAIEMLDSLLGQINQADIPDEAKLNAVANIETVKVQLSLPKPNFEIIKLAWIPISAAADIAGVVELAHKVAHVLGLG